MKTRPVIHLAGSECAPGKEAEFKEWYDKVHIPMTLAIPGFIGATRYERIGDKIEYPRYLTVYEIESEAALEEIFKPHPALVKLREASPEAYRSVGLSVRWNVNYRPVGP